MTGVLEAPPAAPAPEEQVADAVTRHGGAARVRVELRLARRQAVRAWTSSLLVVSLVALPMALLSGAAIFGFSRMATPEQRITAELGQADAWLQIVGGPDPSLRQEPSDPWWFTVARDDENVPINPALPPIDDPIALLPPGTRTIEIAERSGAAETPGGLGTFTVTVGEAWDPALAGRFEFLDGRVPANDREAMVSPGALERLDAELGDTLTLADPRATFTIVGVLKAANQADSTQTLFLPRAPGGAAEEFRTWFTPDWQPTADELPALNREGVVAYPRDLVQNPREFGVDPGTAWVFAAVAAIVATFCAYLVILLAGAAFAVSARRQQRALAVAASVGAPRPSVFRIVLLQGTVLGVVGGVAGVAAGFGLAAIVLPVVDDGNVASYWGFNIPWPLVVGVVVFAVAVGTASAVLPARAATRGDVLGALRGARRPVSVRANRPLWGSLLVALGLALTVASGLTLGALNTAEVIDYGNPLRQLAVVGIIAGPILFQVGVVLAGHWILSLLARGGARVGLAPRIATRDAAANPSRVVPAFGAIAACVFIASFALTAVSIWSVSAARDWWYASPLDTVHVDVWSTYDSADEMEEAALAALRVTDPDRIAIVRGQSQMYQTDENGLPVGPEATMLFVPELQEYIDCDDDPGAARCSTRAGALLAVGYVHVVDGADLDTALGTTIPDAARRAFDAGAALVTDPDFVEDGAVTINQWDRAFADGFWQNYDPNHPLDPLDTWQLDAAVIELPHRLPVKVIVSPDTARELGMATVPLTIIGAYDAAPSQQSLDKLALTVSQPWTEVGGLSYGFETGPPDTAPWLWLILGAAGVLVLGAGAVTLGLARVERRPDDATLTAIGAPRLLRRGIAFWQGVVIVGVGAVTGTLAGIIPMWGITLSVESLSIGDTPWPWLAGLALGLPLAIAVANWLVPPRHPDLTRRTAIT